MFLDGNFSFSLPADILIQEKIKVSTALPEDEVLRLQGLSQYFVDLNKVLNFLSYRPRSKGEVEKYLENKKVDTGNKDKIIEKLSKLGLIDDEKFSRWLVEQRSGLRARGKYLLSAELRQKGIDKNTIKQVLEESRTDEEDEKLAESIARKKVEKWQKLPTFEFRNKLYSFLVRRGFSSEVSVSVIDKVTKKEYNNNI